MVEHRANDGGESSRDAAKVHIEIQSDPTVNYASYQNNVPLVRGLTLTNAAGEPLRDVEVALRCEPAFAEPLRLRFERLEAKEARRLDALDLKFQHRYLAELNEAERGRIVVEVTAGGAEAARIDCAVDVLAYDQWAGSRALPELLAAFSLSNNPAVDRLIFQAGELLARAGGWPVDERLSVEEPRGCLGAGVGDLQRGGGGGAALQRAASVLRGAGAEDPHAGPGAGGRGGDVPRSRDAARFVSGAGQAQRAGARPASTAKRRSASSRPHARGGGFLPARRRLWTCRSSPSGSLARGLPRPLMQAARAGPVSLRGSASDALIKVPLLLFG